MSFASSYILRSPFWTRNPSGSPDGPGDPPPVVKHHRYERRSDPEPDPWRLSAALAASMVEAAGVRVAAQGMKNQKAAAQITQGAGQSIEDDIDFTCGTVWPGPRPWWLISQVVSELTFTASSLGEGALRTELLQIGARLLDKASESGAAERF